MNAHLDFALLDSGGDDAVALARFGHDLAVGRIKCGSALDALTRFSADIRSALLSAMDAPSEAELYAFGQLLFNTFWDRDLRRVYDRLPGGHVRIQIISDRADVQSLPWEYLIPPGHQRGPHRERSIARIVPSIGYNPPTPLPSEGPVRVLLVTAEPQGQDPVSWERLYENLQEVYSPRMPEGVEIELLVQATPKTLVDAVQTKPFDIFHFSGHGDVVDGEGRILLVHPDTGKSAPMRSGPLATLLHGRKTRLAVLSACETSKVTNAPFGNVALDLVRAGLPAVVASQYPLPNASVSDFATAMYTSLLADGDIDVAVAEGRVRLNVLLGGSASEASLEWGIPTLYRHIGVTDILRRP